eukprot:13353981-Alexandrium_andersonii.AAC.1
MVGGTPSAAGNLAGTGTGPGGQARPAAELPEGRMSRAQLQSRPLRWHPQQAALRTRNCL